MIPLLNVFIAARKRAVFNPSTPSIMDFNPHIY